MEAIRSKSTSKTSSFPPDRLRRWKLEGEFISCVATMDFLNKTNELGDIPPEVFHRQIKALLKGAIQSRIELENMPTFKFESFIEVLNISKNYPNGLNFLQLADGSSPSEAVESVSQINYGEITKLPTKAADFVASSIELLDLLRLADIATVDRLLPLLDELKAIFSQIGGMFGSDFWATKEIEEWIRVLNKRKPGTLLPPELAEKLELQGVRWLNTFRRELKNI